MKHRAFLFPSTPRFALAAAITLFAGNSAQATNATWNQTAAGPFVWATSADWGGTTPTNAGDTANLNTALTAAQTVNITTAVTLGTLNIGATSGAFGYTVALSGGSLTMNNSGTQALIADSSFGGSDTISAPISISNSGGGLEITSTAVTGKTFTLSGGITSTDAENLILQANGAGALALSTSSVNNQGTITNSGTGAGTTTIATVGANVTGITESSNTSALTITTLNLDAGTTETLANSSTAKLLTVTNSVIGATANSNLILNANNAAGITLTGGSNNNGTITNSGSGAGTTTITGVIGTNVTGVIENSAGSVLAINGANTFTGNLTITNGTVSSSSNTTPFGSGAGTILLGNTAGGNSNNATLLYSGTLTTVNNPITVQAGSSGVLTLEGSSNNALTGNIALNNNVTLANITAAKTTTFSGKITGSSTITTASNATGTVALTGNNNGTFTGNVLDNSGILNFGTGGLGNGAGSITLAGGILQWGGTDDVSSRLRTSSTNTLSLDVNGNTVTFGSALTASNIAGSGGLTLTSTAVGGVLTLTGAQTYTGLTTVSAGSTLKLASGGATINSTNTLTNASTGTFDLDGNSQTLATLTNAGTVTSSLGTPTLTIADGSTNTGTITGPLNLVLNDSTIGTTIGGTITNTGNLTLNANGPTVSAVVTTANNIGTITNSGSGAGTGSITTVGANVTAVTESSNTSPLKVGTLNVQTGGTTTLTNSSTATFTVVNSVVGATAGSNLILDDNNTGLITLTGGANNAGTITNSGSGAGTTTINGAIGTNVTGISNTNTSPLTIGATITLGQGMTIINSGGSLLTDTGAISGAYSLTFQANSTGNISELTGGINNGGTITNSGSGAGTTTIAGVIGANVTGVTENSASSTLVLGGTNLFTGNVSIVNGTLSSSANTTPFGTLTNAILLGNTAAGNSNNATLLYTGNATLNGPITVEAGSSGTLAIQGGTVSNAFTGNIALNNNLNLGTGATTSTITFSGQITGSSSISTANNSGIVSLTGSNGSSFTGAINLDLGTLSFTTNALGNGSGAINFDGGTLQYGASTTTDLSSRIADSDPSVGGAIRLDLNGNNVTFATGLGAGKTDGLVISSTVAGGTLTLTGANAYSGGTLINTGATLAIGGSGTLGSGGVYSDPIIGAGSLVYGSSATETINGANTTFSGSKTLTSSAGTLVVGNSAALGTGTSLTLNGGTLDLATSTTVSTAYNTTVGGNTTIESDQATPSSAGITQTLGTLSIGGQTLTVAGGANVNSGTAGLTFGVTTLTGNTTFNITDPTNGGLTLLTTGAIAMGSANTLTLTGNGNFSEASFTSTSTTPALILGSGYTGTATFVGANATYTGGLTIKGGTASLSLVNSVGSGTIILGDSTGTINTTLNANFSNQTFANAITIASGNTGIATLNSASTFGQSNTFTGPITLNSHNFVVNANGLGSNSLTGGVTGTGNVTLNDNSNSGLTGTLTSGTAFNNIGTITNSGTGVGTTTIANTGSNLTGITQASNNSPLTITTLAPFGVGPSTTLTSTGSALFTVGTLGSATTNLVFNDNGAGGITLTNGDSDAGTIVNSGSGTGTSTINGAIGTAVTAISSTNASSLNIGATIALGGNMTITNSGSGLLTDTGAITGGYGLVFQANSSGNISQLTGTVNNGGTIVNSGSGTGTTSIAGVIGTNVTSVTENGTSALALSGANTFTGGVTLTAGTLDINSAGVAGTSGPLGNGGTLTITSGTIDNTSGAAKTVLNSNPIVINNSFAYSTSAGTANNSLGLPGSVSLNASSTTITLNGAGTLSFNLTGGTEILSPTSSGLSTLAFAGAGNALIGNVATASITDGSGQLAITMASTGTLTLGGANTFTGGLLIKSGTVISNGSSAGLTTSFGAGPITIGDTTGSANATLILKNVSSTYANAITVQSGSSGTAFLLGGGGSGNPTLSSILTLNKSLTVGESAPGGGGGMVFGSGLAGSGTLNVDNTGSGFFTVAGTNAGGYTGNINVQAGTFAVSSSGALGSANTIFVDSLNGATFNINSQNETIAGLNNGVDGGGTVTNTIAATRTLTLGGSGSYSFGGAITATTPADLALIKSGTGTQTLGGTDTYAGATQVNGGNLILTGSLGSGSAVTVGNNTSTVAILSGTGTLSGSLATSTTGSNIAYIAPGVNTTGTRGDFGSVGTLHVGTLGFSVGAGTQFDYDINTATTAGGTSNDLIAMGGGTLTIGGSGIVFNFDQLSSLSTTGSYTLINGASSIAGFTAADFSATGIGTDTATFTSSGGNLYVSFGTAGSFTTGTYTLTSTVGSSLLHVGATTTATTTLTNTGTGSADSLNYTGLGSTGATGTVTGTAGAGGPVANAGGTGVATQTYTALTAGTDTVTPTGTVTGANSTPTPVDTGTATATIQVYSGTGSWTGTAGGVWGTAETASPANWTALGGIPGITPGFLTTDSASFGNSSTTQTITLSGASPSLNNITFNNTLAGSYDIEQGGTGTIHLENSGTSTATLVDTAGSNTIGAPIELDSAAATSVASSDTLTINGNVSQGVSAEAMTIGGAGTTVLSGSNTYTGGTTVNGTATLLVSNTVAGGSATGTGALTVSPNATIGGYGTSSGTSFNVAGSGTTTGTRANVLVGLNSASDTNTSQVLTLIGSSTSTITNANLTFNLSTSTHGALGSDPSGSGTELSVGNTKITFGGSTGSVLFSLNMQNEPGIVTAYTPYVLIAGTLPTGGGGVSGSQYTGLMLGNVLVSTGTITETVIDSGGTNNLALAFGNSTDQGYYGANSYLVLYQNTSTGADDIDVVVVPEPSTWAMIIGGLAVLIFWQRRKNKID